MWNGLKKWTMWSAVVIGTMLAPPAAHAEPLPAPAVGVVGPATPVLVRSIWDWGKCAAHVMGTLSDAGVRFKSFADAFETIDNYCGGHLE